MHPHLSRHHIVHAVSVQHLHMLEQLIVRTGLGGISSRTLLLPVLGLARGLEEQTRALSLLDGVTQVSSVCRVAVVLDILSRRGVGQSVLVFFAELLQQHGHGFLLSGIACSGGLEGREDG